ncbi:Palmitoyltransferase [Ascosphaera acerosa]|nr:Palmitoyltransferase [Ascosphaera acerosa]
MADLSRLAIPAVSLLIAFLAYTPPVLYAHIAPGPLSPDQLVKLHGLALCVWVTYYKACATDPGTIPRDWAGGDAAERDSTAPTAPTATAGLRWCRRCSIYKPPRAHHCKTCKK